MNPKTSIEARYLVATTIPDAWFRINELCYNEGREYVIQEGSYVGQKRKELDFVVCHITHPSTRPLLPETPDGVPDPVTGGIEFIENDYLRTIMTPDLEANEQYTYGERLFGLFFKDVDKERDSEKGIIEVDITNQVDEIVEKYKRGFANNQCTMSISRPEDVILEDPPCLRSICTRIFEEEKKLHFFIDFRSWDLFNGFPANLAALVYLNEYMCEAIGQDVEPGEFICMTKGGHAYDHTWKVLENYIGDK